MIMEETFKRILEESANDIRMLSIQMSNFEGTLRAIFSQMDELQKVVHNFMSANAPVDNNTSNVHCPETTRGHHSLVWEECSARRSPLRHL